LIVAVFDAIPPPTRRLCEIAKANRKNPSVVAKMCVDAARKAILKGNKYKDDMTCIMITFHGYGKFVPKRTEPTRQELIAKDAPKIEDSAEKVCEVSAAGLLVQGKLGLTRAHP